ncbi:Ger(x)C family spore germination protein [Brevibacillus dissolubilis]|uniref:Ger(x)C family spore germination protein n=1 Tax=Brevibacillus dissolubilis TaxID=1844116 RepID=UPI0011165BA8|nr:Ger(x)C family spore germination protein [Brevibacillus dissolubilis]
MKKSYITAILLVVFLLTGCWDQRLLKDVRLLLGVGIDYQKGNKVIMSSVVTRNLEKKPPELISTTGSTPRDARINLQRKLIYVPDASKNRIVMLSEALARKGSILEVLDVFYRDPRSALNAKIAIVKGKAKDFLETQSKDNPDLTAFLDRQIVTSEAATIVPDVDLQSIRTGILDPGEDIMMPYMGLNKSNVEILGGALFHGQKLTGTLTPGETTVALLLANQKNKQTTLTLPIEKGVQMTVNILQSKRKLTIQPTGQSLKVSIDLQMNAEAIEMPFGDFSDQKTVAKFNHTLSEEINKEADKVIKKLQAANCDVLGIGRQLIAHHSSYWNQIDWNKEYPKINITSSTTINLTRNGILE